MRAPESKLFKNFSTTQGPFELHGGYYKYYLITGTPSGSNHVDLTRLGADGSTVFVDVAGSTSSTSSSGYVYLAPGQYSWTVTGTLAGIYAEIVRVPFE